MQKIPIKRSVRGRDGWRFVFRDSGQTIKIADYKPITISRMFRGSGPHKGKSSRFDKDKVIAKNKQILKEALIELKAGKYIYADMLVVLCREYGVKMNRSVLMQCKYINELDVSYRAIRHRNTRGDLDRASFNGLFSAMEFLLASTIDV